MKEKGAPLLKAIKEIDEILQLIITYPDALLDELDSFPIPICIFDMKGVFQKVNNAYCQQFGYSREELIGDSFGKVIPDMNREKNTQDLLEGFRKDVDFRGAVIEVQHKERHTFPMVYSTVKLTPYTGKELRISIAADISDLQITGTQIDQTIHSLNNEIKHLETQLDSQEVARNILLHDIKKPFQNILGVCDILSSPDVAQEEVKVWIDTIQELCQKGLQQAEAMQGITQMEMNNFEPNLSQFDLLEFLQEMTNAMHSLISSKEISYQLLYNGQPYSSDRHCQIQGDKLFLELLFSNLMLNAIEASPEGKSIICSVMDADQNVQISIHNHGTVPAEIRNEFFNKYVTQGKSKGTGMGTYIAKLVTDAHHGDISMSSSEGKGTTITIQLPRLQNNKLAA